MHDSVSFFLNGKAVTVNDPAPDLLLIDYLRSPEVGLIGPKKPCGQGGCGGCTVILSRWNGEQPEHRAINSCLRPVCALGDLVLTTIEGTGAVRRPNPEFLRHSLVASRAAASPNVAAAPAVVHAAAAVKAKNEAVLKSVSEALSKSGPPMAKLGRPPADHPSEISNEGVNPVAYRLAGCPGRIPFCASPFRHLTDRLFDGMFLS
jgi:xanthine dehydrogenase/oxidase